jgi:predicted secreted protein
MMTDDSLQVITVADVDTDFAVRAHEVFEVQLPARPATGHEWEIVEQPDAVVIESWRWEPDIDPYESGAAEVFRVWRIHTTEPGCFKLEFRCWQPWEGEHSIVDSFSVTIDAS